MNIYDLIVLDWGIFCHSKKLRISGTEDMEKEYKDYMFHARGTCIGIVLKRTKYLSLSLLSFGGFMLELLSDYSGSSTGEALQTA